MNKKSKNIFIKNFTNLSLNQGINILIAIVATPILFQNLGDMGSLVTNVYSIQYSYSPNHFNYLFNP